MTTAIDTIKDILRSHIASHRVWEDLSEEEKDAFAADCEIEGYIVEWSCGPQSLFAAINEAARKAIRARSAAGMKKALLEMRSAVCTASFQGFGMFLATDFGSGMEREEAISLWSETDGADHSETLRMVDDLLARI